MPSQDINAVSLLGLHPFMHVPHCTLPRLGHQCIWLLPPCVALTRDLLSLGPIPSCSVCFVSGNVITRDIQHLYMKTFGFVLSYIYCILYYYPVEA